MARRKKKPRDPKWITEARKALDEMETWDSDDPHIAARIAPFRTQNWIRKGWGMLAGLKPIAVVVLLALGGAVHRAGSATGRPRTGRTAPPTSAGGRSPLIITRRRIPSAAFTNFGRTFTDVFTTPAD